MKNNDYESYFENETEFEVIKQMTLYAGDEEDETEIPTGLKFKISGLWIENSVDYVEFENESLSFKIKPENIQKYLKPIN